MPALAQVIMRQLAEAAERSQPQMPRDVILLVHADFDVEGQFARGAGVGVGTTALRSAMAGNKPPPGIVLFGLTLEAEFRSMAGRLPEAAPLLDWPGFRYLRLPFSAKELGAAAEAALVGRSAPIPLPTPREVLTSIANVQHWLERVRQGQAGTARIFADVARGVFELPRRSLDPEACLSLNQRQGLERLCGSLSLASGMEDGTELAELLRNDIVAQDVASQRLEQLKAAYLSSREVPNAEGLRALAGAASALAVQATALFERIRYIEARIVEGTTEHND